MSGTVSGGSTVEGGVTAAGSGGGGGTHPAVGGGTIPGGGGTQPSGGGAGDCEREARSVALEKAYVHEVYEQISAEHPDAQRGRTWPKVNQFLDDLEPGSLVCDVGCGSGKYLNVNPMVFNLGGDRCTKLVETAKEKNNEVLVCDNLALPFRDESFDAVLSIAVVHHFATTERRVNALRELTRVLRIGGRLVISVWAMEQRHRKFESQDVLVPWHRPQQQQQLSTAPSLEVTSTTTTTSGEEEDCPPPYHAYTQTSDSDSCRSVRPAGNGQRRRARSRHKGRSIDPTKAMTSSPSSSSLSSPNETCYSFVRKALQKLAGGKRGGSSRHRPWFLESWTSCASSKSGTPARRYEPDGCEDIHDLPIELRRLEGDAPLLEPPFGGAPHRRQTFACSHHLGGSSASAELHLNHKSKSLSDIINVEQKGIVRSRSSVPSLEVGPSEEEAVPDEPGTKTEASTATSTSLKPKLVKQKKSVCEEDFEDEGGDEPTDMKDLIKALPDFRATGHQGSSRRGNVFKQSSMNEELMSTERLKEKEKVRQNIQKQASLNEDLMFRRNRTLDSLRDTLFSASTAKRFQLLKNGFTNKIKSSTTGIEKVLGNSSKHGIVRILQNWTSGDAGTVNQPAPAPEPPTPPADSKQLIVVEKKEGERRHSREDGSDSSKDSSLQSDTSVDSEDSFASVIFVPKPEPTVEQSATSTNTSPTLQSTPASPQPTSPKFKIPPPVSPKLKNAPQISFGMSSYPSSPKLKHPGQLLSGSPLPTSPKGRFHSQPTSPRPFQTTFLTSPTAKTALKLQQSPNGSNPSKVFLLSNAPKTRPTVCSYTLPNISHLTPTSPTGDHPTEPVSPTEPRPISTTVPILRTPSPKARAKSLTSPKEVTKIGSFLDFRPTMSPGLSPTSSLKDSGKKVTEKEDAPSTSEKKPAEKNQEELKQLQDMFKQKPGRSSTQPQYPIVRRSATVGASGGAGGSGKSSSETRASMTKLMSLELFNPETDDMDSDSSGVSSPDSVGSVISVVNEEEHAAQDGDQKEFKKEAKSLKDQQPVKESVTQPQPIKEPVVPVSKEVQPSPSTKSNSDSSAIAEKPVEKVVDNQVENVIEKPVDKLVEKPKEETPSVGVEIVMTLPVPSQKGVIRVEVEKVESERTVSKAIKSPRISPSHSLLEAVADVASSLEETVDAVIQSSPRARRKQLKLFNDPDPLTILQDDLVTRRSPHRIEEAKLSPARVSERMKTWTASSTSGQPDRTRVEESDEKKRWSLQSDDSERFLQTNPPEGASRAVSLGAIPKKFNRSKTHLFDEDSGKSERKEAKRLEKEKREEVWDEECRQHLTDFAEKLSEKLLVEIDRYREQGGMCQTQSISLSPEFEFVTNISLQKNIEIMNDPYLNKLSEELQGLTKLSLELQEKNKTFLNQMRGIELSNEASGKDTGRTSIFKPTLSEDVKKDGNEIIFPKASFSEEVVKKEDNEKIVCDKLSTNTSLDSCPSTSKKLPEVILVSDTREETVEIRTPSIKTPIVEIVAPKLKDGEKQLKALDTSSTISSRLSSDTDKASDLKVVLPTKTTLKKPELCIDTSDIDSEMESTEDSWADSRRNTMLPADSSVLEGEKKDDDLMRIEILPGSEVPRRPSISVETTDPAERALKDKVDMSVHNDSIGPLRSGISLESSDAGDFSERTGSSSDGSRAGSRRDTIQICDSGSVLSLRPGLSLESSDAGDISERTASGSESSRAGDSRRNTISIGDQTSGSQASLLRPGTSLESSDAGDVSDRTGSGSDCSRGKTASTASLTSDRAGSDCSKDARYADRRVARGDGRSSSEDTASHRSCMNKLVRQRASTQEPPETLTKTESCETSLSGSTSQESLMSDSGGGAITFHRYYHVFKEGELDQLIERYVENLHIISSYYDHANWCVIAEKVHVWTI